MYRVIIADDEEYVRELLPKWINKADIGMEVVGTAENGEQALDLVETLSPDILITDICMPLVGGLDLIKAIQEADNSIKTVIISGHDDFTYAKTALGLGVTDYLLKPFLPDELYKVLDKIKEELNHKEILLNNMQDMQSQLEDNLMYIQERFIKGIIENPLEQTNVIEEGRKIRIDLQAKFYCVGVVRIQSNLGNKRWNFKNQKMVEDFLIIIKDGYFENSLRHYAVSFKDSQLTIIFCGNHLSQGEFYDSIPRGIEKINQSLKKYYDMRLICALGKVYFNWDELTSSYHQAYELLKGTLNHESCIIHWSDVGQAYGKRESIVYKKPEQLEKELILNIKMACKDKALECVEAILKYYESLNGCASEFINISLMELIFSISNMLGEADKNLHIWEEEPMKSYLANDIFSRSLLDAKAVLEKYISVCCEEFCSIAESQGDKIIYKVKVLIEHNLANEEFNLESASSQLFFSPHYIRQLFKQKTGEGFVEYLIRRRMEMAAKLLKDPQYKILDVALSTGYSNQRYFASCFKKYYGCTPTEYRGQKS